MRNTGAISLNLRVFYWNLLSQSYLDYCYLHGRTWILGSPSHLIELVLTGWYTLGFGMKFLYQLFFLIIDFRTYKMFVVPLSFFFFLILFIYLWVCWVFVSVRGLSPVAASGGRSSSRCAGLSLSWPLLLRSTGSRCAGSVVVAHGPSCSAARGIFPDQGSNPCPLHWQADSQPLRHQGSPNKALLILAI